MISSLKDSVETTRLQTENNLKLEGEERRLESLVALQRQKQAHRDKILANCATDATVHHFDDLLLHVLARIIARK